MFVIVAVEAEELPVAAVRRIVVVIVVPVVDRQLPELLPRELPSAPSADVRIELQRLIAVLLFAFCPVLPGFGNQAFGSIYVF